MINKLYTPARCLMSIAAVFSTLYAAGSPVRHFPIKKDYADTAVLDSSHQKDMIDVLQKLFDKSTTPQTRKHAKPINISVIPTVGYTLSTGFAIGLSSVTTFHTQADHALNTSVVNAQAFYDSHNQETFFTQANIWAAHDQLKFVTDLRWVKYPDVTYGLGSLTTINRADPIDYDYLRFYQTVLKKVLPNFYAGMGYNLDYHYDIVDLNPTSGGSAFKRYGESSSSRSSGLNYDLLFDSRQNPVNSLQGLYANAVYRYNYKFLGSDVAWSSLVVDVRKYIRLSSHSNNILAIWSYNWITLSGRQPYLDLPSVGADMYNNTGRGYAIDRYRGKNMIYLESEYRFGLTKNGLLGGVIFANAGNYSRTVNANLQDIIPAAGTGLRVKINKHSNTNLCIDYGVGVNSSRGFFVNLGEVF